MAESTPVVKGKGLKKPMPPGRVQDDRDRLNPNRRTILVVEDDVSFAGILYELAHGQEFQCLFIISLMKDKNVFQKLKKL